MSKPEKDKTRIKPIVDRLIQAVELIGYKDDVSGLGKALGYPRADNIYNALSGDFLPGIPFLADLSNKFENLNTNWILTGKGKPSFDKTEIVLEQKSKEDQASELHELRAISDLTIRYVLKLRAAVEEVPLQKVLDEYDQDLTLQLSKLKKL